MSERKICDITKKPCDYTMGMILKDIECPHRPDKPELWESDCKYKRLIEKEPSREEPEQEIKQLQQKIRHYQQLLLESQWLVGKYVQLGNDTVPEIYVPFTSDISNGIADFLVTEGLSIDEQIACVREIEKQYWPTFRADREKMKND